MSRIEVDLNNQNTPGKSQNSGFLSEQTKPRRSGVFKKILLILAVSIVFILIVGAIGGFAYWQYVKTTPQYSLALLVDAARRDDQKQIDRLVDTDAVVDDFMPQVTDKAVELYGKGLPQDILKRVVRVAAPLLPAVKERARAELPGLIREKTQRFENIPFWVIAIGAGQYLDIKVEGENALIKSNYENRPLEVKMKKNGDLWQVVAVKDEALAQKIAKKIGKEIMEMAKNKKKINLKDAGKEIGVENMQDLFDDFKDIFKK